MPKVHHPVQKTGHSPSSRPTARIVGLSSASLLVLAASLALGGPAWADGGNGGATITNPGGVGGTDGSLADATGKPGGFGNPTGNSGSAPGGGGGGVDIATGAGAAGGARGKYGNGSMAYGAAGAQGAAGQALTTAATVSTTVTGGNGGAGAANVDGVSTVGGGGGGGVGVTTGSDLAVTSAARVTGGIGGMSGPSPGGGGGGGGGSGIFTSAHLSVMAGSTVTGGKGGPGQGGAGGGGTGVTLSAGVLENAGALTGGAGGAAPIAGGGSGGAGVLAAGGTITNLAGGAITGGDGGLGHVTPTTSSGTGGVGVKGSNVTLVNAGAITGGMGAGAGAVRAAAVTFTGGVNSLEIWSTSVITGTVQAFSAADTLKLGGATDASFDLSQTGPTGQYQGFGQFAKVGTSTWTLTGATTAVTSWTLAGGVLNIASDGALGDASGALTFNGGALETTADIAMTRAVVLAGAGTIVTDTDTTLTLGGPASGVGALTKAGDGTLVLTGTNTYSGGTTISAGTLIGSATSFGSGAIQDGAALAVNQPTDAALANPIDGAGTFTKTGSGQLTYTGTGTLTGPTTVAAGAMSVNGSLASSAFTVMPGATLKGNGTVGATTIQSGGTIAPGSSTSVLHVNGAFVQQAGSVYQVQVDPTSNASSQIAVTGSATLASGASLDVIKAGSGNYRLGATYMVLAASGGVSGTYALAGDIQPVSAFLALKDSYDANHAYLSVMQTADPASAAQTSNQQAVASGLPSSGALTDAVLNSPTDTAARSLFNQLDGDGHAAAKGALVADSRLVRDLAIGRVQDLFCGPAGLAGGKPDAACPEDARPAAWGQAFGAWGRTDGNGNAGEATRSTGGFLIGADAPLAGIWRAGGFVGYSHTSLGMDGDQASAQIDSYHLGAYAGAQYGRLGLRLGAAYAIDDIGTDRTVALPNLAAQRLDANYGAGAAQAFAQAGYRLDLGKAAVEPFIEAAYVSVHANSFTEHGGVAALAAQADTEDAVFSTLGFKPSLPLILGQMQASLHGVFGWRHDYGEITPASTVRFVEGGSAFTVEGAPLARDAGIVEVGLDMKNHNAVFGLSYGAEGWTHDFDQTIRANFRLAF